MTGAMSDWSYELTKLKRSKIKLLGMPCPNCAEARPKTQPRTLLRGQTCWCGYVDNRNRTADKKRQQKQEAKQIQTEEL